MKIETVDVQHVVVPLAKPAGFALGQITSFGCLLVTVRADDGTTGESLIFTINNIRARVLAEMVESLKPLVIGADPAFTTQFWTKAWRGINFIGHKGVSIMGISALDCAMWDLSAKAAGLPLHRMLGGAQTRLPAYHSGGLWLSQSIAELADEAQSMVVSGFKVIKMRLGAPTAEQDRERARAIRKAIGPNIKLMADGNQGFTENEAIRRARLLEEVDLTWYEEPLPAWDIDGLARVRAAVSMPIASGETEYTRYGCREMLMKRSVDVLMPDLQRIGGVTEFMRVSRMAEAFDVQISSHLFSEMSIQLLGALSNVAYLEYMPWFKDLYTEALVFEDGDALVPDRPGFGFTFNQDYVSFLAKKS
jgi:L-alanine-DL-glutamate epimerase-like enolase superfamily enzyme